MSSKPVGFQDITSNVLGYTISTSMPQCRLVAEQIKQLPVVTQDEIYGRFNAVCNRGEKDAAKGRKFLATSLDCAGLSQQLGKVATDIQTCIEMLNLSNTNASWASAYNRLTPFAREELNNYIAQSKTMTTMEKSLAAYVEKYDPLPPATPVNAASPAPSAPSSSSSSSTSSASLTIETNLREIAVSIATVKFAVSFLKDYQILQQNKAFFETTDSVYKEKHEKVLEIFDSLSPFAQLIIEQNYIHNSASLRVQAASMRPLIAYASSEWIKAKMSTLFACFDRNVAGDSICPWMTVGKREALLLKAYLGFPRHFIHNFLQKQPCGSSQALNQQVLKQYISENMQSFHPDMLKQFATVIAKLGKQKEAYVQQFLHEQAGRPEKLTTDNAAERLQRFLIDKRLYTKVDFLTKVIELEGGINEMLKPNLRVAEPPSEQMLFLGAMRVKNDIDLANQHIDLISTSMEDLPQEECEKREKQLREFNSKLSTPARCLIERLNRVLRYEDKLAPAEQFREACYTFFTFLWGTHPDDIHTAIKETLDEEEDLFTRMYLKVSRDFSDLLPSPLSNTSVISEQEFKEKFHSFSPELTEKDTAFYTSISKRLSELTTQQIDAALIKKLQDVMPSVVYILNLSTDKTQCAAAFAMMPEHLKLALDQLVKAKHGVPFLFAEKAQMYEAAKAYLRDQINEQEEALQRSDNARYGGKPSATNSNQE